jgi:alpha-1,3-rhamnosyl/mannosyltransferase
MPRLLIDGTPIHPNPKGVGRYAYQVCLRLADLLPNDWQIDVLVDEPSQSAFPNCERLNPVVVRNRSEIYKALVLLPIHARRLGSQVVLKSDESAGRVSGLPTVVVCHDIEELIWAAQNKKPGWLRRMVDNYKRWLRARTLRAADYVLCNSEFIREEIKRHYGIPAEKTRVAYCAVDERFYDRSALTEVSAVRRKYGVERFILAFATGDPRENFTVYADVAARLEQLGVPTCLLIAGIIRDAPYGRLLKEQFRAKGLIEGKHVVFEDFLGASRFDDLVDLYTAADFYLDLSLHEGFGMQLVEAMACGTTCVSSPNGALREIGDRYALFVDPLDANAIASCLKKAYEDEQEKRNNKEQVSYTRKFAWDQTALVVANALLQVSGAGTKR